MIGAIAVAAYFALGIPGVVAWILGATAGLSVSGEWEEDGDDTERLTLVRRDAPTREDSDDRAAWWRRPFESDSHLQFALVAYPRVRAARAVYFR